MKTYYASKSRLIIRFFMYVMNQASMGNSLYLGLLSILALGLGFLIGHGWLKALFHSQSNQGNAFFRKAAFSLAGFSFLPFSLWMLTIEKDKPVPNFNQNLMLCCVISYLLIAMATLSAHRYGKSLEINNLTNHPE